MTRVYKIFALVLLTLLTLFIFKGQVSAQSVVGDPDNESPPNAVNTRHVISDVNSTGSFYSPRSTTYLYVPTGYANATVRLDHESSRSGTGTVFYMSIGLTTPDCAPVPGGGNFVFNPNVGSTVTISNNQPTTSQLPAGSVTYNIYCIEVSTTSQTEVFFEISTANGAFIGTYPGGSDARGTGYASLTAAGSYIPGAEWNQLVAFSPPCGQGGANPDIELYDLDMYRGQPFETGPEINPNLRIRLRRVNKTTGASTYLALSGDIDANPSSGTYKPHRNADLVNQWDAATYYPTQPSWGADFSRGPNNVIDSTEDHNPSTASNTYTRPLWSVRIAGTTVRYDPDYKYILEVNGIRNTNLIRIKVPYDQIYSAIDCTPPDVCPNLPGDQATVPPGYVLVGGQCIRPNDAQCNYQGVSILGGAYNQLSDNEVFTARAGDTVRVRMRTFNNGANTWIETGTNPTRLAQNPAGDATTYNEIQPTMTYINSSPANGVPYWTQPDANDIDGIYTSKIRGDYANYFYDFTVPAYNTTNAAANVRDVSYKMYRGGIGFLGQACRWRLQIQPPLPDPECTISITNLRNPGQPIQPGDQVRYTITVINRAIGSTATWNSTTPRDQRVFFTAPGFNNQQVNYGTLNSATAIDSWTSGPGSNPFADYTYILPANTAIGPITASCRAAGNPVTTGCPAGTRCDTESVTTASYVKTFGNDVFTGAGFAQPTCAATPPGNISTRYGLNFNGAPAGSGAQLAVRALGVIQGFQPAALENAGSPSPLAFANSGVATTPNTTPNPVFGGSFAGFSCAPDYWGESTGATPTTGGTVPASDGRFINDTSGTVNLVGRTNFNNRTALFIEGDVFITSNITYQLAGWTSPETIPAFELIVRGNIFISSNVTQLDGFYVAQPNGATGGNIFTCSRNVSGPTTIASDVSFFANSCEKQLVVNGAFAARRVHLFRSADFSNTERVQAGFAQTVSLALPLETRTSSKAAEVFIFGPEMYLARWATQRNGSGLPFTSMLSLPPSF